MREDCNLDWDNSSRDGKIYLAGFSKAVDGEKKKESQMAPSSFSLGNFGEKNCHLLEWEILKQSNYLGANFVCVNFEIFITFSCGALPNSGERSISTDISIRAVGL